MYILVIIVVESKVNTRFDTTVIQCMPNVSFTIKYVYKLCKMGAYTTVLYRHDDRIDCTEEKKKREFVRW